MVFRVYETEPRHDDQRGELKDIKMTQYAKKATNRPQISICQKSMFISRNFHIVQNDHQPFLQLPRTAHAKKKKTNIYYIHTTSVYRKTFYFSTYKNCTHYMFV